MPLEFDPAWLGLSDEDIGIRLWASWIEYQTSRRGIPTNNTTPEIVEKLATATIGLDTDQAKHAALEKALIYLAQGDAERGGKVIREYVEAGALHLAVLDEAVSRRRWLRHIARRDRGDALSRLIYEIVEERYGVLTEAQLLDELHQRKGMGVIEEIMDGIIYYIKRDGTGGHKAKTKNLRGRRSTAIKKFLKNNPSQ